MKNRIAVFANGYNRYCTLQALEGMKKIGNEKDFDIDVFVGYAAYNDSAELNKGRAGIYWLPRLENYDGVIVFSGLINDFDVAKKICLEAKEKGIPVVSIGEYVEDIPFVGTNNETGMRALVEHLVNEHKIKRAVYIGGSKEHIDTGIRQRVIEEVFREHGLELKEEDIYYADWVNEHAAAIATRLTESEEGLPDAIICANDVMALAVSGRLIKQGYKLPQAVLVTGFDHVEESEITYPALTTVDQDYYTIGHNACEMLYGIIEGGNVSTRDIVSSSVIIGESCGCLGNNDYDEVRRVYCQSVHTIKRDIEFFERLCRMERNEILKSEGYEDLKNNMKAFYKDNHFIVGPDYYVVLNREYFSDPQPEDRALLKDGYMAKLDATVALRDGKLFDGKLKRNELIPGYSKEPGKQNVYYYFPLSSGRYNYGYFAFKGTPVMISENLRVYEFMEKAEQSFMEYRLKMRLDAANRELKDLYDKDQLTGLYNRFCIDNKALSLYEKSLADDRPMAVMFADINYMKDINDKFGHSAGDKAIQVVAEAIRASIRHDALAVRYGGDEFIIFSPNTKRSEAEAVSLQIESYLVGLYKSGRMPCNVTISCGYVITDPKAGKTLEDYIIEADDVMYHIKRDVHKGD